MNLIIGIFLSFIVRIHSLIRLEPDVKLVQSMYLFTIRMTLMVGFNLKYKRLDSVRKNYVHKV